MSPAESPAPGTEPIEDGLIAWAERSRSGGYTGNLVLFEPEDETITTISAVELGAAPNEGVLGVSALQSSNMVLVLLYNQDSDTTRDVIAALDGTTVAWTQPIADRSPVRELGRNGWVLLRPPEQPDQVHALELATQKLHPLDHAGLQLPEDLPFGRWMVLEPSDAEFVVVAASNPTTEIARFSPGVEADILRVSLGPSNDEAVVSVHDKLTDMTSHVVVDLVAGEEVGRVSAMGIEGRRAVATSGGLLLVDNQDRYRVVDPLTGDVVAEGPEPDGVLHPSSNRFAVWVTEDSATLLDTLSGETTSHDHPTEVATLQPHIRVAAPNHLFFHANSAPDGRPATLWSVDLDRGEVSAQLDDGAPATMESLAQWHRLQPDILTASDLHTIVQVRTNGEVTILSFERTSVNGGVQIGFAPTRRSYVRSVEGAIELFLSDEESRAIGTGSAPTWLAR